MIKVDNTLISTIRDKLSFFITGKTMMALVLWDKADKH